MYLKFAWRYFRAKKSANAINIIAWVTLSVIAFATCCQVLVLSVFNGFEHLVKSLYSTFYTDIRIAPSEGKTFRLTEQQISAIQNLPYVSATSLIAEEKALLQNGPVQTVINLKGVDENYHGVSDIESTIVRGDYATGDADHPLLIMGSGIQNATGISVNPAFNYDPITIILPRKTTSNDPLESLSEGLIQPSGVFSVQQEFDNQYSLTNIHFVKQQMKLDSNEYSAFEIKLVAGEKPEKRKAEIAAILGNDYSVLTKYEQNISLYNTMRMEKWAIYAVLTLILVIAAFNMISALTMLVLEKKRDISILQAMGSTPKMIRRIFITEGLLLGGLGATVGILLAVAICLLQMKFHLIPLQGGSFLVDYFPVKLVVTDFILVGCTAMFISLVAAYTPARKAAQLD